MQAHQSSNNRPRLELWGGLECTVNRVGDRYFSQLERNGHAVRITDLDLFAGLGIRALRYPVLWELLQPEPDGAIDWSWTDERLLRLRELGIRPIVGLVHHGSGPRHTSLIDPNFAGGLARFAARVAERYPWIDDYTPVNEPLTTARFSGLYGHWYPHGRADTVFARAVFNQCQAVSQAMAAIRKVNPQARLIQTEDLGRIYSTKKLVDIAAGRNRRRWFSLDLLCGRITPEHPLWQELIDWKLSEPELRSFVDEPCMPDIIGVNHYLTSDRFLDDQVYLYPDLMHQVRDGPRYIDVEAVRVSGDCPVGIAGVLRETAVRYGLPVAVTEAHLGCTREEQMRWLTEIAESAQDLWREGLDVRAVTAWSLLGAFNWNVLVTHDAGHYEPGVFDLRAPQPRATALARVVRTLASGEKVDDPLVQAPGWWRRPERVFYPRANGRTHSQTPMSATRDLQHGSPRPLLILGATGTLGGAFARLCDVRGIPYQLLSRGQMDLCDPLSVDLALDEVRPWAVVNAAGYVRVDHAERQQDECMVANATGPALLAASCVRHGVRLLTFSSDLVFDGRKPIPYTESDEVCPLSVYGRSKAEMEKRILNILPGALVIRSSAFFGTWDRHNFVTLALEALVRGETVVAANDTVVSPTFVIDLVHASLDLLVDGESGIWHLANRGAVTWFDLARRGAEIAGITTGRVEGRAMSGLRLAAQRPLQSALLSERGWIMPDLDDALKRFVDARRPFITRDEPRSPVDAVRERDIVDHERGDAMLR